ncbi:MAG: biotin synthase BioB [Gammaproteobacteria bacterium]|nr:biotin synthase BioB [Gammaproteobacteria bacterium]MBU1645910.1 biotin synthase BioB [Gammaproteobacteria bacterium]MBU1971972.1 biotin synthase BioB [Gammaproteobacteria bacterium]
MTAAARGPERAATSTKPPAAERWTAARIEALFDLPFADLLFRAQQVHRQHFDANAIQRSTLLSVKTGGCSEDCGYCSQSARHGEAGREKMLDVSEVVAAAQAAKDKGASRFCMGAAWKGPKDKDLDQVAEMVKAVKGLGLETCVTLGMLKDGQAEKLRDAGLDYYNHNLDTAPEFYGEVISTHSQADRFDTIDKVREAGIKVCCGGIVGMGETRRARASLLAELAGMEPPPDSVPINELVPMPGTPLENAPPLDPFEFVRTIAAARITMPTSFVRLSAGRQEMNDELQALCFLAGANSIFYGDKLLTAGNPEAARDEALFERLGLSAI